MYAEKADYDDIEMSSRLRNVLRRNGFESLEGLREYPKEYFIIGSMESDLMTSYVWMRLEWE